MTAALALMIAAMAAAFCNRVSFGAMMKLINRFQL
jgi:hypothetical protein